ncbi:hypothetical protein NP493_1068g00003 [Ridgeia piscesae]|uniref:Uncharacterized protein n=1 Tax=Ridgeia piscesae TaxID=27915 RepID=A0AAD9KHP4_RIDPI|nr:hypothetical protein NP493_1068g00003 [Ridgeia piscesae]
MGQGTQQNMVAEN